MKFKTNSEKFLQAIQKMRSLGAQVAVDGCIGRFELKGIEGRFYFYSESEVLEIIVEKKPFLISQSVIEDHIKQFLN